MENELWKAVCGNTQTRRLPVCLGAPPTRHNKFILHCACADDFLKVIYGCAFILIKDTLFVASLSFGVIVEKMDLLLVTVFSCLLVVQGKPAIQEPPRPVLPKSFSFNVSKMHTLSEFTKCVQFNWPVCRQVLNSMEDLREVWICVFFCLFVCLFFFTLLVL